MFHRSKVLSLSIGGLLLILIGGMLLLAIILPKLQIAREGAHLSQCTKNLMELTQAAQKYSEFQDGMPPITTNSDGFYPSWCALIIPYAETSPAFKLDQRGDSPANLKIIQNYNRPIWQCPSRRAGQVYNFPASFSVGSSDAEFSPSLPTDYVASHCTTADIWSVHADGVVVNPLLPATIGVHPTSSVQVAEIAEGDGQSFTAIFGEKHMHPSWLGATAGGEYSEGLDIPALITANGAGSIRLAGDRLSFGTLPLAPGPEWGLDKHPHAFWAFGSWHLDRAQFARVDGSVKSYATQTEPAVLRRLISRNDGRETALSAEKAVGSDAQGALAGEENMPLALIQATAAPSQPPR
ncbi:MAG: DUF1559 domain-containing protein [Pirellulales bacterium]|nr:DUF1559 domain-containing protein [Pirellulales bacterium]